MNTSEYQSIYTSVHQLYTEPAVQFYSYKLDIRFVLYTPIDINIWEQNFSVQIRIKMWYSKILFDILTESGSGLHSIIRQNSIYTYLVLRKSSKIVECMAQFSKLNYKEIVIKFEYRQSNKTLMFLIFVFIILFFLLTERMSSKLLFKLVLSQID